MPSEHASDQATTPGREKMETLFQSQREHSRVSNSVVKSPTQPKFELVRAFMPFFVTCKFDKYLIKGD